MYKLLIVEDEHFIRRYLTNALDYQELNITSIVSAENGLEGVAKITEFQPDIVLTDITMPVMDAFEMFEKTSQYTYQKIILSGYNDFLNAKAAIHYGVREFLVKPIDLVELRSCFVQVLNEIQQNTYRIDTDLAENSDLLKDVRYSRDEIVSQIIGYIRIHFNERFTAKELSERIGISESNLYKKMKNHLGITFNDYVNRYRLKMAINYLISDPNLRIYEVADCVGFADYKYFNQVFKKYLGMTVTEFKEKIPH